MQRTTHTYPQKSVAVCWLLPHTTIHPFDKLRQRTHIVILNKLKLTGKSYHISMGVCAFVSAYMVGGIIYPSCIEIRGQTGQNKVWLAVFSYKLVKIGGIWISASSAPINQKFSPQLIYNLNLNEQKVHNILNTNFWVVANRPMRTLFCPIL